MSVRAYRIIEIKRADDPTFNLWHDDDLISFLESYGSGYDYIEHLTDDGSGTTEISVKALKEALKKAKKLELDVYQIAAIKKDIEFAKSRGDEWVLYDCF